MLAISIGEFHRDIGGFRVVRVRRILRDLARRFVEQHRRGVALLWRELAGTNLREATVARAEFRDHRDLRHICVRLGDFVERLRNRRLTEFLPRHRTLLNLLALPVVVTKGGAGSEENDEEIVRAVLLEPEDKIFIDAALGEILSLHLRRTVSGGLCHGSHNLSGERLSREGSTGAECSRGG